MTEQTNYSADHDDYMDERGEYVKCPVCGSADLWRGQNGVMAETSCNACGQLIEDSYSPDEAGDD